MAPARSRSRPGSDAVVPLPSDAVYEVLLRVPGRDLCRFRAVCRPWRRLLSDPLFIAAHAARNPEPLIVAGYNSYFHPRNALCDLINLSGRVVKRVHATRGERDERVVSAEHGFIYTSRGVIRSVRLRSLITGDLVRALPDGLAREHKAYQSRIHDASAAFGMVASTGEYKVLRVINSSSSPGTAKQLYEVCTLDGSSSHAARWRAKKAPSEPVSLQGSWRTAVINGIIYFFSGVFIAGQDNAPDRVASFDLETEEWRPSLRGPLSSRVEAPAGTLYPGFERVELSICAMNGFLVMANRNLTPYMDLWILMDFERGLWVKQHSVRIRPFSIQPYVPC
ncbi:hypothetical protein EJB05_25167, partial [Eragrostis curvula]